MNYLLDTHTFLWFLSGDKQLSDTAKRNIETKKHTKFISIASLWEISIKLSLGKLILDVPLEKLRDEIVKNDFEILPLDFEHIVKLSIIENHHKDPFDRIIIAQAIVENMEVISKDENFRLYKQIKTSW